MNNVEDAESIVVAPRAGARIETEALPPWTRFSRVAPRAGARIETALYAA